MIGLDQSLLPIVDSSIYNWAIKNIVLFEETYKKSVISVDKSLVDSGSMFAKRGSQSELGWDNPSMSCVGME